ncbi:hypothetical protein F0562_016264 [Nyssa sinensis]|uniref:Carboxypeptidase A inhibitor-like domain-containing protein n=1 Tax=Nyssa sinensis TaxID=561372 RepID=A0A5J4ZNA0_9ASTE|nr:hypothetical protein F0562_016264 [Nyssa sinensis]
MGFSRPSLILILLLVIGFTEFQKPGVVEARPLAFQPQQRYPNIFATLGVVCKCCDGGECKSTWVESCSQLQCLPWKLH